MNVLVTRPASFAQSLCQQIQALGLTAELFPVIEFAPTPHLERLRSAIDRLNTADIIIFVSRAAAYFGLQAIKMRWQQLPPITTWTAIGPGTAKALQDAGVDSVLLPRKPPFETESLLTLDIFRTVTNKQIFIFRGNGGRDLLPITLQERGAFVHVVETYQRQLPIVDMVERLTEWHHTPINIIITTSIECLNNLTLLINLKQNNGFKNIPIVVVGLRMFELANTLGFKRPILAAGADDASIIKVLKKFKDKSA